MPSAQTDHPEMAERAAPPRGLSRLFAPVDILPLVYFRVLFGVVMAVEAWRYLSYGWVGRYFVEPEHHFTYFGFDWIRPWTGEGMYWHYRVMGVLAVMIAVGLWYRAAAALFFLAFTYTFFLEESIYLNHLYLVCLLSFLLVFLPAHRSTSVDAALHPGLRSATVPAWTLWLLRFQLGVVYFFGGIAKLNADWLRGEPMRSWLASRADFRIIGPYVHSEWLVAFFVYGGLLLDLFIVPLLMWRRTRWPAVVAAAAFHLINARIFQIGIFPWLMLAATPLFFPSSWWRRMMADRRAPAAPMPVPARIAATGRRRLTLGLLGAWVAIQVLMPLRHFLYPGNVSWTEEGHRFSWHMKLRSKVGQGTFTATDIATGERIVVDPAAYLNPKQHRRMLVMPDMLVQFAHIVADDFRARGREVEVRADLLVSLNARRPQRMVDPSVNLAAIERSLWPADWIVPLTEPLRPGEPVVFPGSAPFRGDDLEAEE